MPASLSTRITLVLVLISLLILGGGSKWMDWRIDHAMERRFEQNLLSQATALSSMVQLEAQTAPHDLVPTRAAALNGNNPTYFEVRCPGLPPQRSSPPLPLRPTGWSAEVPAKLRFATLKQGSADLAFVQFGFTAKSVGNDDDQAMPPVAAPSVRNATSHECVLLFAQDRGAMNELLQTVDWILLLGPALALLLALVAVPLIVRRGLHPMTALSERMRDIGPDAPGERLDPTGISELDPLVARFNNVLERMDEGLATERRFASSLAHETRTRLAELRTLTEVEVRYPSGRSMPDVLTEIGSIGAELEATVAALLLLTRLQSGIETPQWQSVHLEPWLAHQLQRLQGTLTARHLTLHIETSENIRLRSDPALLEVVVGNLLANACAYAPYGDCVTVLVTQDCLSIDNVAPGLVAADLVNLGQRFWRKQLPHASHAGLGLALASAAAHVLNLSLDFALDPQQRLHATVSWVADMRRSTDS